ncbi:hypothetical protein trd_0015 [Thermomicrobium roseum DSM 5159]|uniref:Uncharacterized protein n=1 Tax=Thermomicrobium roseum (strain ATCC 27502 / DSM 5159 / P-2) TaxID=309801 RepID=B9L1B4_THERP|nr:hypothetical protein trd_0015 [Thermomicrobium roseum DSM 5159]
MAEHLRWVGAAVSVWHSCVRADRAHGARRPAATDLASLTSRTTALPDLDRWDVVARSTSAVASAWDRLAGRGAAPFSWWGDAVRRPEVARRGRPLEQTTAVPTIPVTRWCVRGDCGSVRRAEGAGSS